MKSNYEALKSKEVEREEPLKNDFNLEGEEALYEEEDLPTFTDLQQEWRY